MLFNAFTQKQVQAIPNRLEKEWSFYTSGITQVEHQNIIDWIKDKFTEVANRRDRVQPSGWLGSGFDWTNSPLLPIYRECSKLILNSTDMEIEEKAGQIFGLFVSLTLAENMDEKWYYVKGDEYQVHGSPIRSRIYFLPDNA